MPQGPQLFFIIFNAAILIAAIVFVVSELRRRKDAVPLFIFIGAGLAIFYEPLGDMLVSALYPHQHQIVWINTFGRKIPLFIGLLYFWYMSVPTLIFLRALEKGLTTRLVWTMYATTIAIATAYELLGVNLGAWLYYGEHAFQVFGVPLWAAFTYGGFCFVLCAGTDILLKVLDRSQQWLLIPALPLLLAGGHCALALPGATPMFSDWSMAWRYAGASLSIGLSMVLVWGVSKAYCRQNV